MSEQRPCERCGAEAANNGPFRTATASYSSCCTTCKLRLTLTPDVVSKLEREFNRVFAKEKN